MGGGSSSAARWQLRTVPADLVERYRAEGWWTDDTLGTTVAHGLAGKGDVDFRVESKVRPWRGTLGQIDAAARSFAASLQARGVGPGDIVVFQLPNWMEAAIVFWGAAYVGAVVVPVVHFYGTKEVDYILRVTEPDIVVTADRFGYQDFLANYEPLMTGRDAPWLVVGETAATDLPQRATPFDTMLEAAPLDGPLPHDPDLPALVAFTSGTTRDPKGVIHSHRTIGFEARQLNRLYPDFGPPPITGAPLGHFIGMLNALLVSLFRDDPVTLIDVWDPGEVLRMMREDGLGVGGGSTYFMTSLLDHPDFDEAVHLPLLPFAGMGGSPVPVAVAERMTRLGIKVFRSYGSTEHPSITGSTLDAPVEKRNTTDGRPLLGVELRLDDEGQIITRGPELFLGYTDPELTAKVIDDDGWYHTGDVGVLDDDGYLTITDRISDIIIRGGENISAQEIEEQLLTLDPVAEVSVVAEPDERLGEHAAAIIRVRDGATLPTIEEVRAHLADAGLAKQKWPEAIYEVSDFPRTPSGKVQKFQLRQQLREGRLEQGS